MELKELEFSRNYPKNWVIFLVVFKETKTEPWYMDLNISKNIPRASKNLVWMSRWLCNRISVELEAWTPFFLKTPLQEMFLALQREGGSSRARPILWVHWDTIQRPEFEIWDLLLIVLYIIYNIKFLKLKRNFKNSSCSAYWGRKVVPWV